MYYYFVRHPCSTWFLFAAILVYVRWKSFRGGLRTVRAGAEK